MPPALRVSFDSHTKILGANLGSKTESLCQMFVVTLKTFGGEIFQISRFTFMRKL